METKKSRNLFELKDLDFIWKLISNNILLILFVPILAYGIGYVYTYRMADEYGAKVQLLLKNNETYDYQDPIYKGLGAYGLYTDVSNQTRILQSKDIVGEVIDRMNVGVSYFVVGRLKKKEVFGTLPFNAKVELINQELYELPVQIRVLDKERYEIRYELSTGPKTLTYFFNQEFITEDFKLVLSKNYEFNDDNIVTVMGSDYELLFHSKDHLVSYFQQRMTITNLEFTTILEVEVRDNIGIRAKVFLDTLASVFIDFSKRSQLEVNQNTLINIEKQIDEVQKIITNIENELLKYKGDNDILNLTKEEDDYFNKYVEYSKQQRNIELSLNSLTLLEDYVLTSTDEHLLAPSFYILDGEPVLDRRVLDMYEMQLDLVDKIYSYSADHPNVLKLKDELNLMKKDLLIYIKNLKTALELQKKEIVGLIAKYKGNIQEMPRAIQGVDNIRRELEVNNKMYLFLLEKKTNTLIARAGIIPQVQMIEKPSSLGIVGPDKGRINRLFLFSGIVLAFLMAFIRRVAFEHVENVNELSAITSFNIIGGAPYVRELMHEVIVDKQPKSQVAESFRTIRSNISFYGDGKGARKIIISSFLPSEGKTFCSSNLATILARSDKKVLLIDFDLHKPKIHKTFQIENQVGVSTFLSGKTGMEESIVKGVTENMDIMVSGPIPPNPSELIMKKNVNDLMTWAEERYDYVLIDTPPFGLLNDAISLISHSDLFIVVMNTKFANKRGIQAVERMLEKYNAASIGIILNGIRESKLKYYYAKYSYKYGYNYGYGYGYGSTYGYGQSYSDSDDK
jgi:tyrosine-protein kinase Etk/Wzc